MTDPLDVSAVALAALRGQQPELTLYWYEEVKKDLGFDPEAPGPTVEDPQPWNLEDEYPLSLQDQVQALAAAMNWTGEDLSRQKELMAWLHEKERSDADGDTPAWE